MTYVCKVFLMFFRKFVSPWGWDCCMKYAYTFLRSVAGTLASKRPRRDLCSPFSWNTSYCSYQPTRYFTNKRHQIWPLHKPKSKWLHLWTTSLPNLDTAHFLILFIKRLWTNFHTFQSLFFSESWEGTKSLVFK